MPISVTRVIVGSKGHVSPCQRRFANRPLIINPHQRHTSIAEIRIGQFQRLGFQADLLERPNAKAVLLLHHFSQRNRPKRWSFRVSMCSPRTHIWILTKSLSFWARWTYPPTYNPVTWLKSQYNVQQKHFELSIPYRLETLDKSSPSRRGSGFVSFSLACLHIIDMNYISQCIRSENETKPEPRRDGELLSRRYGIANSKCFC